MDSTIIPLSQSLLFCDAYALTSSQPAGFCDHILTDPDQANDHDISLFLSFIPLAFHAIAPKGYFGFYFPISRYEQFKNACEDAGFLVQPWPLIFAKNDFARKSNPAPTIWFAPSYETLMLCRKPDTILAKAQLQSVFIGQTRFTQQKFHSFYSKPVSTWRWILHAISRPGQIFYDPFAGSGTSLIASIECKLATLGSENEPETFKLLTENLQAWYLHKLGSNLTFT